MTPLPLFVGELVTDLLAGLLGSPQRATVTVALGGFLLYSRKATAAGAKASDGVSVVFWTVVILLVGLLSGVLEGVDVQRLGQILAWLGDAAAWAYDALGGPTI